MNRELGQAAGGDQSHPIPGLEDCVGRREKRRGPLDRSAAAPIDAPTVVLAVVVENAGFGSTAAAPIARRVFDYLMLGHYPSEEDMALTREGKSGPPVGKPRRAADMPLPGQAAATAATAASAAASEVASP